MLLLATIVLVPAYALCPGSWPRLSRSIAVAWCRAALRLARLRLIVTGAPHTAGPTLFIANHTSYLDIPALASLFEAPFVAKSEVAGWPLFGWMAKVRGTAFVDRDPSKAREQYEALKSRLSAGESLVLFPEGTSTNGLTVAPFKTALFGVADPATDVVVQPVAATYARAADGTPLHGDLTDLYCWYSDMTLVPHLLRVMGSPGADVEVRFADPVRAADFPDRKALARHCRDAVAAGVATNHGLPALANDEAAE